MENSQFLAPVTVSTVLKKEVLANLSAQLPPECIEWLDSLTTASCFDTDYAERFYRFSENHIGPLAAFFTPLNAAKDAGEHDPVRPGSGGDRELNLKIVECLLERQKTEPELADWIAEIIYEKLRYHSAVVKDLIKDNPSVQNALLERCRTIIKYSGDREVLTAAKIIGMYRDVWQGLKPLLITFRESKKEWVNEVLQVPSWDKDNLVRQIDSFLNFFYVSRQKIRQDMANGLADWLKPLPNSKRGNLDKRLLDYSEAEREREGFDIAYTEPDPVWRYAYVRAIGDLGVNVDGKGHYIHSILDNAAQKDPSPMVREAAAKVSAELQSLRDGWKGNKHAIRIALALWWLKRASRLALNLPLDEAGALATRNILPKTSDMEEDWAEQVLFDSVSPNVADIMPPYIKADFEKWMQGSPGITIRLLQWFMTYRSDLYLELVQASRRRP